MKIALTLGLASALAITAVVPASAQYAPTPQYQRDMQNYQEDRADYAEKRADYQDARREYERKLADYEAERARYDRRYGTGAYLRVYGPAPTWDSARWDSRDISDRADLADKRADYQEARRDYERKLADYDAARARYDRLHGSGAYLRLYGPAPTWDSARWDSRDISDRADLADKRADYQEARREYERKLADYEAERARYDRLHGSGAYLRTYGPTPVWDSARWDNRDARGYARDTSYGDPCRSRSNSNAAAGGIIGALAGAALGSNIAARNARTEGAVLGAVVGGVAGASIGKASTHCDDRGYYFTYNDTVPYRESRYDRARRSGEYNYSYYSRQRCRLAAAPIEWDDRREVRYVRVCPDATGRYRITG